MACVNAQVVTPPGRDNGKSDNGQLGRVGGGNGNGNNPPPPPGVDTLNFCSVVDGGFPAGQIVTRQVQFCIQNDSISPGNGMRLTITRNGGPVTAKKVIDGPDCPDGCLPGLWQPCANFNSPDPALFPDGPYTAVAEIYNTQTNTTVFTVSIGIVLDNTAPVVSQTLTPSKAIYNGNDTNVAYHGTATDASGFRSYELSGTVFNETGGSSNSPLNLNKTINMSLLPDGAHTITLSVVDKAGFVPAAGCRTGPNTNDDTIEFTVDKTPPTVTVNPPGTCLKGTVTVSWTVNQNGGTPLTTTRVKVDGVLKSTQPATDLDYDLDTTSLSDGAHTLRVEVDDEAGNTGAGEQPFTVDNHAPTIQIINPVIVDPGVCQEVLGPNVNIAFTFNEQVTWTLTVDGGTTGLTPANGAGTTGNSLWTPGDTGVCHNFVLTAIDACNNTTVKTFILKIRDNGPCDCIIVPNLIWRGAAKVVDPFSGDEVGTFRPECITIDSVTIRDILNCHGVQIDQNLIIQAVCVKKTTPYIKCSAFVDGPGSGLNTNFDTGPQFATIADLDKYVCNLAFKLPQDQECLGCRCLLFSPPDTTYIVCVTYVVRDPITGRVGPPITKELCWKVEIPDKDVIRCNIEYFSTVALGRTQKCKITAGIAEQLNACLDLPNDLDALFCFETILGTFSIDFRTFIGPGGDRDVRFVTDYIIDSEEEPVACLLLEQALSILFHP